MLSILSDNLVSLQDVDQRRRQVLQVKRKELDTSQRPVELAAAQRPMELGVLQGPMARWQMADG